MVPAAKLQLEEDICPYFFYFGIFKGQSIYVIGTVFHCEEKF